MKKIILVILWLATFQISCNSQPQVKTVVNDANAEKREVSDFNGVSVSNAIQLYLSQGSESAVAVSCSDADKIKNLTTEVKNGVLVIKFDGEGWSSWGNNSLKLKAYVSVKNINHLKVSGASSVKINETLNCSDFTLKISGASSLKGNIVAQNFKGDISGASSVNLSGKANETDIECSGASTFKSFDFASTKAKVDCSGASSVQINASEELIADAAGASTIRYSGNPTKVVADASGASSIKKKD